MSHARIGSLAILAVLSACSPPRSSDPAPVYPPFPIPDEEHEPERPESAPVENPPGPEPESPAVALTPAGRSEIPDLTRALATDRSTLIEALDRSLEWFTKPSSKDAFPVSGVTHERAHASVHAFKELALNTTSIEGTEEQLLNEFELLRSLGGDGRGTVLFTGYYTPSFEGARRPSPTYRYPLYRTPPDLVKDSVSGRTLGRRVGARLEPYPSRAELLGSGALDGLELVWLRDAFEAYVIQVQGSAVIRLPDGSNMQVAFDATNELPYTSVALELVADGRLARDELSLPEVRDYFRRNPGDLDIYSLRNERFVFFREDTDPQWPAGSLGMKVTPLRSLAADKELFPPGVVVLVDTRAPEPTGGTRRFLQLMLDQDSGGAIKSPGRADIYYGIGPAAGSSAGSQYAEGRLYYFLLREERVVYWLERMAR